MPFKSQAQAAYLEHHPDKIGGKEKLKEWENATRGRSLPKRAPAVGGTKSKHRPIGED